MSSSTFLPLPARVAFAAIALAGAVACSPGQASNRAATALPDAKLDASRATAPASAQAVFAGGCFWGVEGVFEHVKGVTKVVSGYAGGSPVQRHVSYEQVSTGDTGYAESVRIDYDPSQVSYGQLLKVFFAVAHDPTQRGGQGPDRGNQYRSSIFYSTPEQQKVATGYIAQLTAAKAFDAPITTQVVPLANNFVPAEAYHQDYMRDHPNDLYIVYNDAPKLVALRKQFPALYRGG